MRVEKELVNLFKVSLQRPKYLLSSLGLVIQIVKAQVLKRITKCITDKYPERAIAVLNTKYNLKADNRVDPKLKLEFQFDYKTSLCEMKGGADFNWSKVFDDEIKDQEILCSVSRWYWLIYDAEVLKNTSVEKSLLLVKHWIRSFHYDSTALIWESYNASERISSFTNAIIFQSSFDRLLQIVKEDEEILEFLKLSANHISGNLEYYPGKITYNHVVNDLKGLLTIAIILNDKELVEKASTLLFKEIEILVNKEGFIREGSSHYQFIVTRWIIELEWLCKLAGRTALRDRFAIWSKQLLKRSVFYLVKDKNGWLNMPLIGDVSPDFDPKWIIDYFAEAYGMACNNKGLSYGAKILSELGYTAISADIKDISESCEYITRINHYDFILFVHHHTHNGKFIPNHAHDDFSSYVLFYKGDNIISDPGRVNYILSEASKGYMISTSHNVIQVEGLPVQTSEWNRHLLPENYKRNSSEVSFESSGQCQKLMIRSRSLNRISNKRISAYTRTFTIDSNRLIISDEINGKDIYHITGQFILHPQVEATRLNEAVVELSSNKQQNTIEVSFVNMNGVDVTTCAFSNKYQSEVTSRKVQYKYLSQQQASHQLEFKFK